MIKLFVIIYSANLNTNHLINKSKLNKNSVFNSVRTKWVRSHRFGESPNRNQTEISSDIRSHGFSFKNLCLSADSVKWASVNAFECHSSTTIYRNKSGAIGLVSI